MAREKKRALPRRDIGDMTRLWSDVKNRRAHRHDVVNLARVNDPDELFSHHHYVQVSGGQRTRKVIQGLIRKTLHVAHSMPRSKLSHFDLLTAATDEAEHDLRARFDSERSVEQRVEWMAGTVVP